VSVACLFTQRFKINILRGERDENLEKLLSVPLEAMRLMRERGALIYVDSSVLSYVLELIVLRIVLCRDIRQPRRCMID